MIGDERHEDSIFCTVNRERWNKSQKIEAEGYWYGGSCSWDIESSEEIKAERYIQIFVKGRATRIIEMIETATWFGCWG